MKIPGVFLILAGIVCFAVAVTGLRGWMTPVPAVASPTSIANSIGAQLLLLYGAGTVGIICGAVALWLGIKRSRERKRQGTKASFRKLITVSLAAVAILACGVFAIFKVMTRWDPDEEWAAKVIEESADIRSLLESHREENGEFPMSLDEIAENYTKPIDYLSRNVAAPDTDQWFYDRIGRDDYQLFVTADSWVSYFDAMVYRHKGEFADPWFAILDSSDSKEFGKWRYVQGFSRFYENYYFDADGKVHSNYP